MNTILSANISFASANRACLDRLNEKNDVIFNHSNYRDYLKTKFSEKIQKNPSYSLRAFAKHIGVSPAQLSQVFSGSRQLSYESGLKIGRNLGLGSDETEYFCLLIQSSTTKDQGVKHSAIDRMSTISHNKVAQNLDLDSFKVISDWYHIPILEMTELPVDQFVPRKIAKRLGLSVPEVEVAIQRLIRLKLLIKNKAGIYQKTYADGIFTSEHAHFGLRDFHKKMLRLSEQALDEQSNDEKFTGSETFAFDPAQLKAFKVIVEQFF